MNSIQKAIYFGHNYPSKFLEEAFAKYSVKHYAHLLSKWHYSKNFFQFFTQLDTENQLVLSEYIENYYSETQNPNK